MKVWECFEKILAGGYLALVFRVYIGWIFIYASMYKISYAGEFAETIAGYQIVPFWAVNFMAVVMPWTELFCGLLLVVGVRTKSAAAVVAAMLVMFIFAIAVNLIRGTPIGCGCFQTVEEPMNWTTLVRDFIWLAMTLHVYFSDSALQLEKKFLISIRDI